MPDDNKTNHGNRENESRQSPGHESQNDRGGSSNIDRERDAKGRFESDDSESGFSSPRGGSSKGSGSSSEGSSKKK